MKRGDVHTISTWLGPEYVTKCAKEHGLKIAKEIYDTDDLINNNDWIAVLGAEEAYKEIRGMIRNYLRFVKTRDKASVNELQLAQSLRAMGYVGNFQTIVPVPQTEWRTSAINIWNNTGNIPGLIKIPYKGVLNSDVKYAVLKCISMAFVEIPYLNRSLLKDKLWQRISGHILMPVELDRDVLVSILLDPSKLTKRQIKRFIFRSLRRSINAVEHELNPVANQLLREWYKHGFIASPAAASVSFSGKIDVGWAALSNNGIPLAVSVGMKDNNITLACSINHQIWDGSFAGDFYSYVKTNLPKYLETEW